MRKENANFSLRIKDADPRCVVLHHYAHTLIREPRRGRAVIVPGCPFFLFFFWTGKKRTGRVPQQKKSARKEY